MARKLCIPDFRSTARVLAKLHTIRPDTMKLVDLMGRPSQLVREDICETMFKLWENKPKNIAPQSRDLR